ncbi:hypothetical protein ACOBR2_05425 [Telmatobacter bradus]
MQLTQAQFALLVGGIDLSRTTPRKWLRQPLIDTVEISQKSA